MSEGNIKKLFNLILNKMSDNVYTDLPEGNKKEVLAENKKQENDSPVVEDAVIRCSNMQDKNRRAKIIIYTSNYDERNGGLGVRDIDVVFVPDTFEICNKLGAPCKPIIEDAQWKGINSNNLINGRPSVNMLSYMICISGCGIITLVKDGQKRSISDSEKEKLILQAYETMHNWLLGGKMQFQKRT